jgi:hypothetical protein
MLGLRRVRRISLLLGLRAGGVRHGRHVHHRAVRRRRHRRLRGCRHGAWQSRIYCRPKQFYCRPRPAAQLLTKPWCFPVRVTDTGAFSGWREEGSWRTRRGCRRRSAPTATCRDSGPRTSDSAPPGSASRSSSTEGTTTRVHHLYRIPACARATPPLACNHRVLCSIQRTHAIGLGGGQTAGTNAHYNSALYRCGKFLVCTAR